MHSMARRFPSRPRGVALDVGIGGAGALAGVVALATLLPVTLPALLPGVVALYAVVAVGVLGAGPQAQPTRVHRGLGAANRVTLLRAGLSALIAGLLLPIVTEWGLPHGVDSPRADLLAWTVFALGLLALLLDGVDGQLARRLGISTAFGARFDMEVDAALILLLCVAVWQLGAVGAWVLAIGALRYAFVAAAFWQPALRAPLPESVRRKSLCVVQGVALLTALAPVVPGAVGVVACGAALALLCYSFGVDVVWLLRHGDPGQEESP